MTTKPNIMKSGLSIAIVSLTAVLSVTLSSCIQAPPPRTYNPQVSRHLRDLAHDSPVTPIYSSWNTWIY